MPRQDPKPVLSVAVTITHDILTSNRVTGHMTIFEKSIGIFFHPPDQPNPIYFTLSDVTVQILPNLDNLLVIGSGQSDEYDIYIFLHSSKSRDHIAASMRLLDFTLIDASRRRIRPRKIQASNSLPSMSTIFENVEL